MKKLLTTLILISSISLEAWSQSDEFSFKFYGRIRADIFYNTRANNETIDGMFFLYPKDHNYDAEGNDLNAEPQGSLYMMCTRMGVNIGGPKIGNALTSANIEVDFRGSGSNYTVLRMRHAYVNLAWERSQLLVGQTWHPMFGEVMPNTVNLSTGAPFQPFNRSPQIRYRRNVSTDMKLTAAAVWQMQYTSMGPDGKSNVYQKNGCIPELYAGLDYNKGQLTTGIGADILTIKPRIKAEMPNTSSVAPQTLTYKVNERVTSLSFKAYARWTTPKWTVIGKTVWSNNLTHLLMLGGFGATSIQDNGHAYNYTPFRNWSSWLNFTYGKKWQPGIFLGYMKNLGTGKAITGPVYGVGLDVDKLLGTGCQVTYNLPHWKVGAELSSSTAWFGSLDNHNGRVVDTHSVTNLRMVIQLMYIF